MEIFLALFRLLGTPLDHVDNVTIIGDDPILPSPSKNLAHAFLFK